MRLHKQTEAWAHTHTHTQSCEGPICTHVHTHTRSKAIKSRRMWAEPLQAPPLWDLTVNFQTHSLGNHQLHHHHHHCPPTPTATLYSTASHRTPNSISHGLLLPWQLHFPEASGLCLHTINGLTDTEARHDHLIIGEHALGDVGGGVKAVNTRVHLHMQDAHGKMGNYPWGHKPDMVWMNEWGPVKG